MKLGQKAMEALKAEITGKLTVGDEIIVAGAIALQGTALLVKHERKFLEEIFSQSFLYDTEKCSEISGVSPELIPFGNARILPYDSGEKNCHAVYAMGSGGVLCALWKMAEASGTGLEVDLRKIPVRQETIEICERLDLNPYQLLSGGAYLLGTDRGEALVQFFQRRKIPAAVIGRAVKGNNRILYSGDITRFLDRPGQDEITKMPWGAGWISEGFFPGQERKNTVWQD